MSRFDNIFFDLDGTLTDPKLGITSAVQYAVVHYLGLPEPDRDTLTKFIGPPLDESFMTYYGLTKEQAVEAIESYREYYRPVGVLQNTVYDGVPGMLKALKESGKTLLLATSKPEVFAKQIADHYGFSEFFDCITGSTLDGSLVKKADVIEEAAKRMNITDRSRSVMVGDRLHDIDGAKKTGLYSVAVLYGYGSLAEFTEHGADKIVSTVTELCDFLLG